MGRYAVRRVILAAALACLLALALPLSAFAQTVRYGYDALGRLIWVQDQTGEVAIYVYDPTGNILQILRGSFPDPSAPVGISAFTPSKGAVGTTVTVFGKGFSSDPTQTRVTFNGTPAPAATTASTQLTTSVPPGATTGPLAVSVGTNTGTSAQPFTVLERPTVSPATAALFPTQVQTFTATQPVQWRVNNLIAGDTTRGTITATGTTATYVAPAVPPPGGVVTITAAHLDDFTLQASATVEILAPTDPLRAPPVSVARAPEGVPATPLVAPLLSVARMLPTLSASPFLAPLVSVAPPPVIASPLTAPLLSVARGPAPLSATPLAAPLLAAAREPVVTAVSPGSGAVGATLTLTLTGAGLTGTTALVFNLGTSADSNITVNSFTVDSATQLTATIAIASGATTGLRVVRVTAGGVTSSAQGTGGNLFQVAP